VYKYLIESINRSYKIVILQFLAMTLILNLKVPSRTTSAVVDPNNPL
jgi:hypothetical protein